jgi:hypothetical protein
MDVQRFSAIVVSVMKKSLVHLIRGADGLPMREWEAEMRNARFEVCPASTPVRTARQGISRVVPQMRASAGEAAW